MHVHSYFQKSYEAVMPFWNAKEDLPDMDVLSRMTIPCGERVCQDDSKRMGNEPDRACDVHAQTEPLELSRDEYMLVDCEFIGSLFHSR